MDLTNEQISEELRRQLIILRTACDSIISLMDRAVAVKAVCTHSKAIDMTPMGSEDLIKLCNACGIIRLPRKGGGGGGGGAGGNVAGSATVDIDQ